MRRRTYNKYAIVLLTLLINKALLAQASPFVMEDYSFVSKQFNNIELFGSEEKYKKLYEKMDNMLLSGLGQVNIVHFGGSHVQADVWPNRTRYHFQKLMPGAAGPRGFLFPYKMAKTNNPSHFEVEYTGNWESCRNVEKNKNCLLGLSGISVTTKDTATTIRIIFPKDPTQSYYHKKVKIFHHLTDSSYNIYPLNREAYKELSDTITGLSEFIFEQPGQILEFEIRKTRENQNYFTLFGISFENDEAGFTYSSIGVNGATVSSYNRCNLLPAQIKVLKPDLVVFSIGINDAYDPDFTADKYLQNYDTLVSNIKASCPDAAILFTTNTDSYYKRRYPNKRAFEVREVMIKLAEKHGAGVWDMFNLMGGLGSIKEWGKQGLAKKDLIHMTHEGYQLMGDLMYNAMLKSYIQYSVGKP